MKIIIPCLLSFTIFLTIFLNAENRASASKTGKLIVLNGTSCAGKTSTAKLLQYKLNSGNEEWQHVTIDYFFDLALKQMGITSVRKQYDQILTDKKFESLCFEQLHMYVLNQINAGINIVLDYGVHSAESFGMFLKSFSHVSAKVFFVKMYCSYEAAIDRLYERNKDSSNKRFSYSIDLQFNKIPNPKNLFPIHENKIYDFELDSSSLSIQQCVQLIYEQFCLMTDFHAINDMIQSDYWSNALVVDIA